MELAEAEARLGITLPDRHRRALLDMSDPIHEACDFLVLDSPSELLRWVEINTGLHSPECLNRWPDCLVAFASNGCGDYFAYDVRAEPYRIIYMDPFRTVDEHLSSNDRLEYDSFESWYNDQLVNPDDRLREFFG